MIYGRHRPTLQPQSRAHNQTIQQGDVYKRQIVGMALSDRVKICDATDNIVKITFCRELINEQRNHASGHS